jgi:cysteinyl-tRNA synthetase
MYPSGVKFPLSELGEFKIPDPLNQDISDKAWDMVSNLTPVENNKPSDAVLLLLEQRQQARARKDFSESDHLRDVITAHGWTVQDSKEGQVLVKS